MAFPLPEPPKRVLIVRMSHLGDISQTIPLIHAARAGWPGVELAWAVQPEFAALIEPLVDLVIPFGRQDGIRAWPTIRQAMRRFAPDLVIDAQGNWKSAAAARLSGAPHRFGFARLRWQEPLAARIFGVRTPAASTPDSKHGDAPVGMHSAHLLERIHGLASALTGSLTPRIDAAVTDQERAAAAAQLPETPPPRVVLHPGAPGDPRSWPEDRFRDLAAALVASGQRPLILTGPSEHEVGKRLQAAVPQAAHIVGQRGLRTLAALFRILSEGDARLVTGDSGPAHVAAGEGLGVVLVAGPEDPARTGPWPIANGFDPRRGAPVSPHCVAGFPSADLSSDPASWAPRPIGDTTVDCVLRTLHGSSPSH